MPMLTPRIIRGRFAQTKVQREPDGRNILLGLPKREAGELEAAASILASRDCRKCAKCCSGGFGFTKRDPNYEEIMGGIKKDGNKFIVEKHGGVFSRNRIFEVFIPIGRMACGFLEGENQAYSQLEFAEGLAYHEDGAVFGCGLYEGRPSVCKSYPFVWELFEPEYWRRGADNALVALDPSCPAIWEAANKGIGYFTGKEIAVLGKEGENVPDTLLGSFAKSLVEIFRRLDGEGKRGRIFIDEKGEEIYPFDFPSVIHSLRDY